MWTTVAAALGVLIPQAKLDLKTAWEIHPPPKLYASAQSLTDPSNQTRRLVFPVTSTGELRCVDSQGSPVWTFSSGAELTSNPTVADLDGDGQLEILVGSNAGKQSRLFCVTDRGDVRWSLPLLSGVQWTNAVVGELLDTEGLEIALGSAEGHIYCVNATGEPAWIYRLPPSDAPVEKGKEHPSFIPVSGHLASGDVDRDGWDEVVVPGENGYLYCINGRGNLAWKSRLGKSGSTGPVIVHRGTGDEAGILCASGDPGALYLLTGKEGKPLWRLPVEGELDSPLAVGDLDGDGAMEVTLANTSGLAFCVSLKGNLLWKTPVRGGSYCAPALADLDNDTLLEVILGTRTGVLYVLNHQGEILLERDLPSPCLATPTVTDLNGRGGLEIVVPGRDGALTCLETEARRAGRIGWSPWRPGDASCCLIERATHLQGRSQGPASGEITLLCDTVLRPDPPSKAWIVDNTGASSSLRLSLLLGNTSRDIGPLHWKETSGGRIGSAEITLEEKRPRLGTLRILSGEGECVASREVVWASPSSLETEIETLKLGLESRSQGMGGTDPSRRNLYDLARLRALPDLLGRIQEQVQQGNAMDAVRLLHRVRSLASRKELGGKDTPRKADASWLELLDGAVDPEVLVLGETAEVGCKFFSVGDSASWLETLAGATAHLDLIDVYGSVRASSEAPLRFSHAEEKILTAHFDLTVPLQIEKAAPGPLKNAPLYEGQHHLVLRVVDKEGHRVQLYQSRLQDADPFPRGALVDSVTVCDSPVVLRNASCLRQRETDFAFNMIQLENVSEQTQTCTCRTSLCSLAGRELAAGARTFLLEAGKRTSSVVFLEPFWPQVRGEFLLRVGLYDQRGVLENSLEKRLEIPLLGGGEIRTSRANSVRKTAKGLLLDLFAEAEGLQQDRVDVTVYAGTQKHAAFKGLRPTDLGRLKVTLPVSPHWGLFDVEYLLRGEKRRSFKLCQTVVATCVEVEGTNLVVNGEPFLLKSVNVHGLQSNSRKVTEQTMRILKEHGFNNLRADWPPLWQVRLAREVGLSYMPLGPYSCTETDRIDERFPIREKIHDPWNYIQKETLQFIEMFRDEPNVLLWNSANEVGGNIRSMLLATYPLYHVTDPYERPVTYANLGDQGEWQGMDIVGVNLYAWHGMLPRAMQSNIDQLVALGHDHGKPVIFTEYNHWWGPVHRVGAEAVRDMGQYALDRGMAGTTLYKSCDVPDRHPGLLTSREASGNVNLPMSHALARFHADAEIQWVTSPSGKDLLQIKNRRPFTLQSPTLFVESLDRTLSWERTLRDVPPGAKVTIPGGNLPKALREASREGLRVQLNHLSHYGLESHFSKVLFRPTKG